MRLFFTKLPTSHAHFSFYVNETALSFARFSLSGTSSACSVNLTKPRAHDTQGISLSHGEEGVGSGDPPRPRATLHLEGSVRLTPFSELQLGKTALMSLTSTPGWDIDTTFTCLSWTLLPLNSLPASDCTRHTVWLGGFHSVRREPPLIPLNVCMGNNWQLDFG